MARLLVKTCALLCLAGTLAKCNYVMGARVLLTSPALLVICTFCQRLSPSKEYMQKYTKAKVSAQLLKWCK